MQQFSCSTALFFGQNALEHLNTLSAKTVLVVTDSFFSQNGLAAAVGRRVLGAEVVIFDRVKPDPPAALAAEGAALLRRIDPEIVIALGGGSAMDCAKGILAAAEKRPLFIAIPTSSGTGSEVTSFSILTLDGVKKPLVDPTLRPDCAILESSLLEELPSSLIADGGMDAVTHCVEAMAAKGHSPLSDALAGDACGVLLENLPRSYAGETACRSAIHVAATMAGMAFDNAGLGVGHALAHALGGVFHVPHGRLGGILLPAVVDCNASACGGQYARLAHACGMDGATESLAIRALRRRLVALRRQLHLPATLREAGIDPAALEQHREGLIAAAMADPCLKGNPRTLSAEELGNILKEVAG